MPATELKKRRAFRKFSYRGIDLDQYAGPTLEAYYGPTLRPVCPQTPRPLIRATSRCRSRPRPPPIQPRAEAQAHGFDQEAPQGQAGSQAEREARARENAPAEHDCGARDDWERDWDLQRQGVQSGGDQAGDGGVLLGRVQYLLVGYLPGSRLRTWPITAYVASYSRYSSKPVKHGRPGIGATHSSRFIPLK